MGIKREQGRLGWSGLGAKALGLASALFIFSSQAAWSLDLAKEIARKEAEVSQVSMTLGRDRGTVGTTRASASSTSNPVSLRLIKKVKKASKSTRLAHKKAHKTSNKVAKHAKASKHKKVAQKSSKRRGGRV